MRERETIPISHLWETEPYWLAEKLAISIFWSLKKCFYLIFKPYILQFKWTKFFTALPFIIMLCERKHCKLHVFPRWGTLVERGRLAIQWVILTWDFNWIGFSVLHAYGSFEHQPAIPLGKYLCKLRKFSKVSLAYCYPKLLRESVKNSTGLTQRKALLDPGLLLGLTL